MFTNILFLPFASSAGAVGDENFAAVGKTVQSDESRHMALGMSALKMLLEEDDRNVPIIQGWLDKWYWRAYRMFSVVATLVDYYPRIRPISWKKAFEIYVEEQVFNGLFKDLRKYGIRLTKVCRRQHQRKRTLFPYCDAYLDQYKHGKSLLEDSKLQPDDYEWLTKEYPIHSNNIMNRTSVVMMIIFLLMQVPEFRLFVLFVRFLQNSRIRIIR